MNILSRMAGAWWPPRPPTQVYTLTLTAVVPGPITITLNSNIVRVFPIQDLGLIIKPGDTIDLGSVLTQKQILDSQELKRRVADGTLIATNSGTTPLLEQTNSTVTVDPGAITIGAVSIVDGVANIKQAVKYDGTNNAAVVVQNSPTPGVSTAALQSSIASSLASIETTLTDESQNTSSTTVGGEIVDETGTRRTVYRSFSTPSSSGSTQVIASQGSGLRIRVLSVLVMAASSNNVKFQSGVVDISATFPIGANGGLVMGDNPHGWFQTSVNSALNIHLGSIGSVACQAVWHQTT